MDFAPNKDGLIAPDQVAAYKEFGDWIRSCYGSALASTNGTTAINQTLLLALPDHQYPVDRIVLQEDQTQGQLILAYEVEAQEGSGPWTQVSKGQSIGNKRIDLMAPMQKVSALRLRVTALMPGSS